MSHFEIKAINDEAEIKASTGIIRESFHTVALEFGLTPDNCPSHPSNITFEQLLELKKKDLRFFGLFAQEKQVGFVAIESAVDGLFYFEKLAVLPEYRHCGYGSGLVHFVLDYALKEHGKKVRIGIINEHTVLKEWYQGLGFSQTGARKFSHLPFTVGFMEIKLNMNIRPYIPEDEPAVIDLWHNCGLVRPWNNPGLDIQRKLQVNPELFLIGLWNGQVTASAMGGYEGHRGWVNYLAVKPAYRKLGFGRRIMIELEKQLLERGCPKINLQVRQGNEEALAFYSRIGYKDDAVTSLGKRLIEDPPVESPTHI
jgi:ribosomal protein S18 acetylase RimI-like enzyme